MQCSINKRKKEYIIVTTHKTKNWIGLGGDPIMRVPVENNDHELINAVIKALESSRINITDIPREDMTNMGKENLKKMGQKSYTTLYRNSNSCNFNRLENDKVILSPYKPYNPGNFNRGLVVAEEGVIETEWDENNIQELEKLLIEVLNHDYK